MLITIPRAYKLFLEIYYGRWVVMKNRKLSLGLFTIILLAVTIGPAIPNAFAGPTNVVLTPSSDIRIVTGVLNDIVTLSFDDPEDPNGLNLTVDASSWKFKISNGKDQYAQVITDPTCDGITCSKDITIEIVEPAAGTSMVVEIKFTSGGSQEYKDKLYIFEYPGSAPTATATSNLTLNGFTTTWTAPSVTTDMIGQSILFTGIAGVGNGNEVKVVTTSTTLETLTLPIDITTVTGGAVSYDGGAFETTGTAYLLSGTTYSVSVNGVMADIYDASDPTVAATFVLGPTSSGITVTATPAPTIPDTPDLTIGSDTGSSNSDNVTNDDTPTFTVGNTVVGETIQLKVDGVNTGSPIVATGTTTTLTAATLSSGTITATATNQVGIESSASSGLAVTIDITAPSTPTIDLQAASDSNVTIDDITNDVTPTFDVTSDSGSTIQLLVGATPNGSSATSTGSDTFTATTLSESIHSITVTSTDTAGNIATSAILSVTVDTTAPNITSATVDNTELDSSDQYTESCTAIDIIPASPSCTVQSGSITTSTLGAQSVTYVSTDTAGNSNTDTINTTIVDTTDPTFNVDVSGVDKTADFVTNLTKGVDTYIQGTFEAQSDISGIASSVIGGNTVVDTVAVYTVTYTVTDNNGLTSVISETVNVTAGGVPVITVTGANPINIVKDIDTYSEPGATVADTEDGASSATVGGDTVDESTVGVYTVTYDATDSSGNNAVQKTRTVNVTAGGVPVITVTGANPQIIELGDDYTELNASVTDVEDDNTILTTAIVIDSTNVNTTKVGIYTVTYNVQDSSGNDAVEVKRKVVVTPAGIVDTPPNSTDTTYTIDDTSGGNNIPIGAGFNVETFIVKISNAMITFDNTAFVAGVVTVDNTFTIITSNADVMIPAGTTIVGTGWDGVLSLPTITSVSVSGFDSGVAIQFGDPDRKLTFSKPIMITLPDQTGKFAFITEFDGTQDQVTKVCDNETSPTNVPAGFACVFDNGADLVIHTLTASVFSSGSSTSAGGDSNKHRTAPTSGLDWTTHRQIVTDGFRINDFIVTIDDNWWTDFPEQKILLMLPNEFEIKTYAQNGGLLVQELCFGLAEVGLTNTAEVCLEAWYDYQQNIVELKVIQETDVIDVDQVYATTSEKKCSESGDMKCTSTLFSNVKFKESMRYNVMAIKSIDQSRRSMMPTSLNDGIDLIGVSINPKPTMTIPGIEKYEGLITITQIEKYSNLWISDDGRIFDVNSSGSASIVDKDYTRHRDTDAFYMDRNHSEFDKLIAWTQQNAINVFDSSKLQKPDKGFISPAIDEDGIDNRSETLAKLDVQD